MKPFYDKFKYNIRIKGQKSYNGVAILSKYPLSDVETNIPFLNDTQSRYIEAWVNYRNSGFRKCLSLCTKWKSNKLREI